MPVPTVTFEGFRSNDIPRAAEMAKMLLTGSKAIHNLFGASFFTEDRLDGSHTKQYLRVWTANDANGNLKLRAEYFKGSNAENAADIAGYKAFLETFAQ